MTIEIIPITMTAVVVPSYEKVDPLSLWYSNLNEANAMSGIAHHGNF